LAGFQPSTVFSGSSSQPTKWIFQKRSVDLKHCPSNPRGHPQHLVVVEVELVPQRRGKGHQKKPKSLTKSIEILVDFKNWDPDFMVYEKQ